MTKNKPKEIIRQVQQDPNFTEIFSRDWRQPTKSKPRKQTKSKEQSK